MLEGKCHSGELALVVIDVRSAYELPARVVGEQLACRLLEQLEPEPPEVFHRELEHVLQNVGVGRRHEREGVFL